MTRLTDCKAPARSRNRAPSLATLLKCAFWAAAGVSLALLHVYVKFTISDQRISARQLQRVRERLENEANALRVEVLRLNGPDRLEYLSKQWGMTAPSPDQIETMRVPATLVAKYQNGHWRAPYVLDDEPAGPTQDNALARMVAVIPSLGGETKARAEAPR